MRARAHIAALLLAGFVCSFGWAQQPTIIESEGHADASVVPDEAHFEFVKKFAGPTLTDLAAKAGVFEKAVTRALDDLGAKPLRQDALQLIVPDMQQLQATARVSVWFGMPVSNAPGGAGGPLPLAELAEKLRKAGVSLLGEAKFLGFAVHDPAPAEQDVVSRASENALYHAEALGDLISGTVTGVERISVQETKWDGLEPKDGALTIPPAVQCSARVRISYQYTPKR